MRLDTSHIRTLDVGITPEEEQDLFDVGADTMRSFLETFDLDGYLRDCRGGGGAPIVRP